MTTSNFFKLTWPFCSFVLLFKITYEVACSFTYRCVDNFVFVLSWWSVITGLVAQRYKTINCPKLENIQLGRQCFCMEGKEMKTIFRAVVVLPWTCNNLWTRAIRVGSRSEYVWVFKKEIWLRETILCCRHSKPF